MYKENLILELDYAYKDVEDIYKNNILEEIKENERLIYVALTRAKNKLVVFNNLDQQDNNLLSSILSELENKEKYSIKSTELEFNNNKYHENKVANYSIELDKFRILNKINI